MKLLSPERWPYRWRTYRSRFQNLDLFGIGDLVVSDGKELRIIQVKFGRARSAMNDLRKVKLNRMVRVTKELWVYKNGKKFKGWEVKVVP